MVLEEIWLSFILTAERTTRNENKYNKAVRSKNFHINQVDRKSSMEMVINYYE